jgi:hypothetical protein
LLDVISFGDHKPNRKSSDDGKRLEQQVDGKRTWPDGADKVTGRAAFMPTSQPGMLVVLGLRSPHPMPASNRSTSRKAALPGVKAVMTGHDLVEFPGQAGDPGIQTCASTVAT